MMNYVFMIMSKIARVLVVIMLFLMTSCTNGGNIKELKLDLPDGIDSINAVNVTSLGEVVIGSGNEIWYRDVNMRWHQPLLEDQTLCLSSTFLFPTAFPDGRIGALCYPQVKTSTDSYIMVAYDLHSHKLSQIVPEVLPNQGWFSWSPSGRIGILSTPYENGTLYWVGAKGIEPVEITLTDNGKSWFLPDSDALRRQTLPSSTSTQPLAGRVGEVGDVRWSPVDDRVAFWATLVPVGGSPVGFRSVAWNMYVLDATTLQVTQVVHKVYGATSIAWSPNGKWIAYANNGRLFQSGGIWVYSTQTGKSTLVRKAGYSKLAWSADGQSILATRCIADPCEKSELWQYDVRSIVSPSQSP